MRVYHLTHKANSLNIFSRGLEPLACNRPRELRVADVAFDIVAEQMNLTFRRKGLFAWLEQKQMFDDSLVLGIEVDPTQVILVHQAWIDLAWGIVERLFGRIRDPHKKRFEEMDATQLFYFFGQAEIYEGKFSQVLFELARNYWSSAVTLAQYNNVTRDRLNQDVVNTLQRFPGLLPHLDHEVCIGVDVIEKDRITIIK